MDGSYRSWHHCSWCNALHVSSASWTMFESCSSRLNNSICCSHVWPDSPYAMQKGWSQDSISDTGNQSPPESSYNWVNASGTRVTWRQCLLSTSTQQKGSESAAVTNQTSSDWLFDGMRSLSQSGCRSSVVHEIYDRLTTKWMMFCGFLKTSLCPCCHYRKPGTKTVNLLQSNDCDCWAEPSL